MPSDPWALFLASGSIGRPRINAGDMRSAGARAIDE
jgi:hypothetical protein